MAGGRTSGRLDLVELFNPNTGTSCVITGKLDQTRDSHTGDGNLVCGGWTGSDYISSCYNVATGDTITPEMETLSVVAIMLVADSPVVTM